MLTVGQRFQNKKNGEWFEVIKTNSYNKIDIKFDGHDEVLTRRTHDIIRGVVKNPFKPTICGIGYFGFNNLSDVNKHPMFSKIYNTWKDMIKRCYDGNVRNIAYYGIVKVDEKWHSFKNFYEWVISDESIQHTNWIRI